MPHNQYMIEQFFGQPIGIYDLDVPDDLNKQLVDFAYHCYELQTKHVDSAELAQYTDDNSHVGAHANIFNRCHLFATFPKDIISIINEQVKLYLDNSNLFSDLGFPFNVPYIERSWPCIIKPNDNLKIHNHKSSTLSLAYYPYDNNSGDFLISDVGINTFYKEVELVENIKNIKIKKSRLIIFPSNMFHWTDTNKSNNNRISYSIDYNIVGEKVSMPPVHLLEKLYEDFFAKLTLLGEA